MVSQHAAGWFTGGMFAFLCGGLNLILPVIILVYLLSNIIFTTSLARTQIKSILMRRIHVVINPASGRPQPILHTLNRVFRAGDIDWDISLTKKSGDAERFARQAAAKGVDVVAAYGGDGTVMEVARGLLNSPTPLAILPGGTANLMSVELGIPKDLEQAVSIACSQESQIRLVDVGQARDTYFLLRVGLGFAARKVELANRKLKNKFGIMAYTIAGLKALAKTKPAHYRITLDGRSVEVDGLTCLVDNAGNMGVSGISPAKNISISDGWLDVLLIIDSSFSNLVDLGYSLVEMKTPDSYVHWQAKEIEIDCDTPESIQIDGEMAGETPVSIRVIPQALRVLTPAPAGTA
jgi:diacylglycerol kinase (ATP)